MDYPIRGVDLSSMQAAAIDWRRVAASGVRFAYARCGNGNNRPDGTFAAHADGAAAAGIAVGAYHVGFPIDVDALGRHDPSRAPEAQAEAHHALARGYGDRPGTLPPALDLEWPVPGSREWSDYGCTPETVRAWALAYLTRMRELVGGRAPVLYDGFPIYWQQVGGAAEPAFADFALWRVDYRPNPATPKPWTDFTLWQVSGGKTMRLPDGEPVDEDVFNGDECAWRRFLLLDP